MHDRLQVSKFVLSAVQDSMSNSIPQSFRLSIQRILRICYEIITTNLNDTLAVEELESSDFRKRMLTSRGLEVRNAEKAREFP